MTSIIKHMWIGPKNFSAEIWINDKKKYTGTENGDGWTDGKNAGYVENDGIGGDSIYSWNTDGEELFSKCEYYYLVFPKVLNAGREYQMSFLCKNY